MAGLVCSRVVARAVRIIAFSVLLAALPGIAQARSGKAHTRPVLDSVLFDAGAWRKEIIINSPRKAPSPPARFFTIANVLSRTVVSADGNSRIVSLDTTLRSDAPGVGLRSDITDEPFGLVLFRAPEGTVSKKWHALQSEINAEIEAIDNCRRDSEACSLEAVRFIGLTEQALASDGAGRIQAVNSIFNEAIRYRSDIERHGVVDQWNAPLATLQSGTGDCEDYAVAKFVALRQIGLPASDLKVLLVRDTLSNQDHAVLGVRHDGYWLLLDNRWSQMTESSTSPRLMPLFSLGDDGVKLFTTRYADNQSVSDEFDPAPAADGTSACGGCSGPTPYLL